MAKAQDAFRTISEVADELAVQKHVLRFWENKFPHIRPMKRGGGRRFYRPDDLDLLRGIRYLLHREGYTIKGVQKILREQGPEHVKACWQMGAAALLAAESVPAPEPLSAQTKLKGTTKTSGAAKSAHPDLATQLEALVAELEAAQAILHGKPIARRPMGTKVGGVKAGRAVGLKTAVGKPAAPQPMPKKARGR
jgi:DNA-binding transcriptional MerR regulator